MGLIIFSKLKNSHYYKYIKYISYDKLATNQMEQSIY